MDIENQNQRKPKVSYFRFANPRDRLILSIGGFFACLNGAGTQAFSFMFGELFNALGNGGNVLENVSRVALAFLVIGIIVAFAQTCQIALFKICAVNISSRIRMNAIQSIIEKNMSWFDSQKYLETSSQIDADCKIIEQGISEKLSFFIQNLATFLVGLVLGFTKGWQLALVMLAVIPFLAIGGVMMTRVVTLMTTKSQESYSKAGSLAYQKIAAISTVTQFNAQIHESEKFNAEIKKAKEAGEKKSRAVGSMTGYTQLVEFIAFGVILWYGAKLISDKTLNSATNQVYTGGDVITVFFSLLIAAFSIGQSAPNIQAFFSGKVSAERLYNLIDSKQSEHSEPEQRKEDGLEKSNGEVRFQNVTFRYPTRPDILVLKNISFSVKKGDTIAFVGSSGCGKSTVMNLLLRYYEPESGNIYLDGKNISSFDLKCLRKQIGVVSQEPFLFSGSILSNLKFGMPKAHLEEVIKYSKIANAHEFIENLPEGYETLVDGNSQLSGGQKQRLAIARALIKNPSILILDEATSALDYENEMMIKNSLNQVSDNCSTLMIAHRLSTIRNANRIYVLDEGKIVEEGNHESLMNLNGKYKTLVEAQDSNDHMTRKLDEAKEENSTSKNAKGNSLLEIASSNEDNLKTEESNVQALPSVSTSRIFGVIRKYRFLLIFSIICASIHGAIFPSLFFVLSEMIEIYYLNDLEEMRSKALIFLIVFIFLGILMFLISIISHSINGFLSEYLVYEFRSNIYLNILRQDLGFFDKSENSVGVLTTRLSSDVQCLQALTIDRLNLILFGLVSVLIGIVIGFYYDWRLTLVIFSLTPLLGIIGSLQVKLSSFGADEVNKGYESITSKSLEYISHIKTIKAFTREEQSLKEFASDIDEYLKKERKMGFLSGLGSSLMVLFSYAMYAFIYYIGAVFLQKGWITFEGILKVSNGVMVVVIGLAQISQISADSGKSKLSLNAIYELLDFKSSIDGIDDSNGLKPEIEDQDIVFSNVSFAYPSRTKVKILEDFNLRIQAKKSTGIVGTSGCGKSTILALIQRLYECDGNILLGETNIRDLNVKHLRSKIGVVSQEPVLFEGTIRENILYGNPLASEDELKSAIEQSNVSAFIDTLDFTDNGVSYRGLDANIGSKGVQLSVGQKQRVAIARAIIKNPEILLLDEATSALDSESEYEVQEALKKAMKGRTTIMISHRLSTMKDADQIIVMDAGKIAEQGNHEELVELNGLYANLCRIGNSMK